MKHRLALSLLTAFALLWQGAASATMAPMSATAAGATPPCHMRHEHKAPTKPVAVKDCCAGAQCHCAAACGASALPVATLVHIALPRSLPTASTIASGFNAATLPQPLRPPILRSV